MADTAADYARRVLEKPDIDWDENKAVDLLAQQCQQDSQQRQAFGNIDRNDLARLTKRAREVVRKVLRDQGRR